jgi:hypothetical protein
MKGAIAEMPVIIKNNFNLPFSFLAMNVSAMPRIRNINPKIATNGKNVLLIGEGKGAAKYVNKRMKIISKE